MPPPYNIAPNDIIEVVLWTTLSQQTLLNTFHFQMLDGPADDGPAYLDAVLAWMNSASHQFTSISQLASVDSTQVKASAQKIWPVRWQPQWLTIGRTGGVDSPSASPNVCWSLSRRVAQSGKGYNGRIQLGAIPAIWCNTGFVNIPAGAPATAYGFLTGLLVQTWTPTGYAFRIDNVLFNIRKTPPTVRRVLSASAQQTTRVMHRRTVGLGI